MNLTNLIKIALRALSNNKFRGFLTMLGIIIGVASVITMLAIGQGSKLSIQEQISKMGSNMMMIDPGKGMFGGVRSTASSMQTLKMADYESIAKNSKYISKLTPVVNSSGQVIFGTNNAPTSITGAATLSPCTTLKTPSGRPACWSRSAISNEADGSRSLGLSTNVLPHAIAIGCIHIGTIAGKLNGVMPAQTPSGWSALCVSIPRPASSARSPFRRCGAPVTNSTTSMPRCTEPAASASVLQFRVELSWSDSEIGLSQSDDLFLVHIVAAIAVEHEIVHRVRSANRHVNVPGYLRGVTHFVEQRYTVWTFLLRIDHYKGQP